MWQRAKRLLQERVSSLFYSHGLFCASHPFAIISLVITIILMTSYPLTTLPLPGNAPLQYRTPLEGYKVPPSSLPATAEEESADKRPRWYLGTPMAYILQVVVKSTVSPWVPTTHIQTDAFRAPLSKVFDILQHINNFQHKNKEKSVSQGDVCLHVFETVAQKKAKRLLPEYNCLTISPAHFWSNDKSRFDADSQIVKTVTQSYGQPLDLPPSIHDLLFGIPLKDTGIRRIFFRNRQRVISYAVTVLFKKYDEKYVSALRDHLQQLYPLRLLANSSSTPDQAVHIYFKDVNYFVEYTPLLVAYVVLFLYLYFSVRKIEMVKSKWGLALSAVVTVVSSLLMSIGICTLFGFTPSINGSEIFPYLVVIIGLENVLVVTKSVVSTPVHLDVKLRVAQGLRKEGWSIFKNLMTELLILAVGFFTFVPAIQEFCLFAVVGLLSDFFLQMFFFTTVLSIDIRRMELSDLRKQSVHVTIPETTPDAPTASTMGNRVSGLVARSTASATYSAYGQPRPEVRQLPYAKGSHMMQSQGSFTDEFSMMDPIRKTPKRVKLMNYWAQTRFMQRAIMMCVIIWIALIVYKTGLVEHLAEVALSNVSNKKGTDYAWNLRTTPPTSDPYHRDPHEGEEPGPKLQNHGLMSETQGPHDDGIKYLHSLLTHHTVEKWRELSYNHWPTLLSNYNMTMRGRYITMLPSIHLSLPINTEEAVSLRHPEEERNIAHLPSHPPTEEHDPNQNPTLMPHPHPKKSPGDEQPFLTLRKVWKRFFRNPQSRTELVMTVLLGIASFILCTYCMTKLYMCMCSRNYHRGRNWWFNSERRRKKQSPYFKQIRETVPLILESHVQEVECLVTDGPLIVSACLGGHLSVWDSMSGECITSIYRRREPPIEQRSPAVGSSVGDSIQDLRDYPEQPKLIPPADISPSLPVGDSVPPRIIPGASAKPMSHSRHRSEDFGHRRNYSADFSFLQQMQQPPLPPTPPPPPPPQPQPQMERSPPSNISDKFPDLTSTIDTDFRSRTSDQSTSSLHSPNPQPSPCDAAGGHVQDVKTGGYDFGAFIDNCYEEHRQMTEEKVAYMAQRQGLEHTPGGAGDGKQGGQETEGGRTRSLSQGDCPDPVPTDGVLFVRDTYNDLAPAVWCLACQDSLIVTGCGNGRIEFWDGLTGALKFVHQDSVHGVTAICLVGHKVIAARINGVVDFLELETSISPSVAGLTTPTSVHKRQMPGGLRRINSSGGLGGEYNSWDDVIHIKMIDSVCAHQRPINVLQSEGGRVITASQDHTLKVFRVEDSLRLYTLHGHTGGVTTLFLDKVAPLAAASGAEDGAVRLWDLMTGACVHKLRGHAATVTSVMCTSLYVISVGMDDQLCVWERCKGHLLHWIQMEPGYCNTVSMLTSNLMVTGGQGCLHLWDVSKGEVLRAVTLGDSNPSVFIRHLRVIGNSTVVCDYGNQLRVIHFPAVLEKAD